MSVIRRNYKDSLFCHLFGSEAGKANALELYNALAGTSHRDVGELELTTIGDTVFLGMKNDVSFLIGDEMVLWEHQSTHNPNMPLRGLQYFARLYSKLIEMRGLDIYSGSRITLPTPRYMVFYFGERERPDREVMALSDSFSSGPGDLEVTATVLNCNEGFNEDIMEACEALRGYAHLIALARVYCQQAGASIQDAVAAAVSQCIAEGMLVEYLVAHRAEVEDMLFTIQDEERAMRVHWEAVEREAREKGLQEGREKGLEQGREEGRAEGRAEGLELGREEGREEGRAEALKMAVRNLMVASGCDAASAMDMLGVPDEERSSIEEAPLPSESTTPSAC